jgi:hypothetical protein
MRCGFPAPSALRVAAALLLLLPLASAADAASALRGRGHRFAETGPNASGQGCAFLGDRLRGLRDRDSFRLGVGGGERIALELTSVADPRNRGQTARLRLTRGEGTRALGSSRVGSLPLHLEARLPRAGELRIEVEQVLRREPFALRPPLWLWAWLEKLRARRYEGEYCLTVRSSGTAASTLAASSDVELQWIALAEGDVALPPFERRASGVWDGRIQPEVPLLGERVYGLVLTRGVSAADGRALEADADFRSARGSAEDPGAGPIALYRRDPLDPANPYPEARLVDATGHILLPDRVVLRGLDPDDPGLDAARARLHLLADDMSALEGFSTTAPLHVALSEPLDLATLTPDHVLLFERTDGALDLAGLLAEAGRHGVDPEDVALAVSFPTQRIEPDLREVRQQLLALGAAGHFDVAIQGVFRPGGPAGPFATYLEDHPEIGAVVRGLLPSPEFRGANGSFDPAKVSGETPAEDVALDFLLTLPATGAPPYPVVIAQHGFGGSNAIVTDEIGPLLAVEGIAVIGISAVAHGSRGSPIELLTATPLGSRGIFLQTVSDQMALLTAIEHGIDVDGDGAPDLRGEEIGYLGISLGGILGGVLAGVEERVAAYVLNVMGGRVAYFGQAPDTRAIFEGFLASRVGLLPTDPRFDAYLDRILELGELAQNPSDPLNWARRYRRLPAPGEARRRILIQQGEGDRLVRNEFTEELAATAGFATNRPATNPEGVSGHWIFEGPEGHGIFARDDVREQALHFLTSAGTEIIDPGP